MTRFVACLVILDRRTHARLIANLAVARSDYLDMQCRALDAERRITQLQETNRRLNVAVAVLDAVNEDLRDTVRMDEALLGFGEQQ